MLNERQIRAALLAIPNWGSDENSTREIAGIVVERTGEICWVINNVMKCLDSAVAFIVEHGQR